ncbi:MAG: hypothetical protein K2P07_06525, partial [Lachnospiraceae bacterium]|nr:hypothetical protein [Lachnospiraceae bacterium]
PGLSTGATTSTAESRWNSAIQKLAFFYKGLCCARFEKAGQFLFCKCMRYVLALFQFWGLRNNNPCHAAITKIFNEFPDDQCPDIAGTACLRILLAHQA